MIKVAITGGIGSGKSTVSQIIRQLNYTVLDCDEIANEYLKRHDVVQKIQLFIPEAVNDNGTLTLNIPIFKKVLFSDENKRKQLNALVHPAVIEICMQKLSEVNATVAFCEVPILFDGGYDRFFDRIIIVTRDIKKRIESVQKRSNLTREEIVNRINAQTDYKTLKGDYIIIENNGDIPSLKKKKKKAVIKIENKHT